MSQKADALYTVSSGSTQKEDVLLSISSRMINPVYHPYLFREERYQVFYGGAGSGKSFFVCQKLLIKLLLHRGRNLLVVRKVERTNRTSTFPLFSAVDTAVGAFSLF